MVLYSSRLYSSRAPIHNLRNWIEVQGDTEEWTRLMYSPRESFRYDYGEYS